MAETLTGGEYGAAGGAGGEVAGASAGSMTAEMRGLSSELGNGNETPKRKVR